MRLATWNVNSVQARLPRLLGWLEETRPDVLCLQETKAPDAGFPVAGGRRTRLRGRAVRHRPLERGGHPVPGRPGRRAPRLSRRAWVPRPGGPGHLRHLRGLPGLVGLRPERPGPGQSPPRLQTVLAHCPARRARHRPRPRRRRPRRSPCAGTSTSPRTTTTCGIRPRSPAPPTSRPEERAALAGLLDLGLTDVPARALKGQPFTYWDYRAGMFHKGMGMRIDLVLASGAGGRGGQGRVRGPGGPQGQGAVRPRPDRGRPGPARGRLTRLRPRRPARAAVPRAVAAHRVPAGGSAYPRHSWLPLSGSAGTSACTITRRSARRWPARADRAGVLPGRPPAARAARLRASHRVPAGEPDRPGRAARGARRPAGHPARAARAGTARAGRGTGATEVHLSRDPSPYEAIRGRRVRAALDQAGVTGHAHPGVSVVDDVRAIRTGQGRPYTVFTPFYRNWDGVPRRAVLDPPKRIGMPAGTRHGRVPALASLGLEQEVAEPAPGGESAGLARLAGFLDGAVRDYDSGRDQAGDDVLVPAVPVPAVRLPVAARGGRPATRREQRCARSGGVPAPARAGATSTSTSWSTTRTTPGRSTRPATAAR